MQIIYFEGGAVSCSPLSASARALALEANTNLVIQHALSCNVTIHFKLSTNGAG